MKRLRYVVFCISISGLASCSGSSLTGQEQVGHLSAIIQTSQATKNYTGTGVFITNPDPRSGGADRFQLVSEGFGHSEDQIIGLYRYGAGLPTVGFYELAPVDRSNPLGFVAYYHTRDADGLDSYVSLSGTVAVTAASTDHIEGTFELTGAQYCSTGSDSSSWCVTPAEAEGKDQIEIIGSFVAERRTDFGAEPLL